MTDKKETNLDKSILISVVINCYNGERFLKEAIDSVYSQTYSNWELIFWDNASTDKTESIARSYNNKLRYFKAPKLKLLHEARNLALDKCRGDVIAFLDADDIWLPDKLEKQVGFFSQDNKIIYGGYQHIDAYGKKIGITQNNCPSGFLTSALILKNTISMGSVLIDTALLKKFKFDEYYAILGDFDLWIRLSIEHPIKSVSGIVELSRQYGDNLSDKQKNRFLSDRRYFYKKFLRTNSIFKFPAIILYIFKTELKGLFNAR